MRDNSQYLWNLAKICSLAIASAERDVTTDSAGARDVATNELVGKARQYLLQAKAVAKESLWEQLAAEIMTDTGFETLRGRLEIAPLVQ